MSRHPNVKWAQRSDALFITVDLPDAQDVKLKLEPEGKFLFSATTGPEKTPYEVDLDLYDKIDVNESKASVGLRNICYLVKKAEDKWWSRLIKQQGKAPIFLKVDWDKWVDEDEEPEVKADEGGAGNNMDFGDFDFSKVNMGGDGMGGLNGLSGLNADALGKYDENDDDSDTEDETVDQPPSASGECDAKPPVTGEQDAKASS